MASAGGKQSEESQQAGKVALLRFSEEPVVLVENSDSDKETVPISRIPVASGLPKKGILKRSSSFQSAGAIESTSTMRSEENDSDTITPLRSERGYTPPGGASDANSKIPKLSVSWWETSSEIGGAPPRMKERFRREGSSDDDDVSSVGSSASISGTWWFGKQTRYVPHCERRHLHGEEDPAAYLTPTQKKNQEVSELKKQLRQAHRLLEDKDRHLSQLRDRLTELEALIEEKGGLAETHRLMTKMRRMEEEFERERADMTEKSEEKIKAVRKDLEKERAETKPSRPSKRKPEMVDRSSSPIPELLVSAAWEILSRNGNTEPALPVGDIVEENKVTPAEVASFPRSQSFTFTSETPEESESPEEIKPIDFIPLAPPPRKVSWDLSNLSVEKSDAASNTDAENDEDLDQVIEDYKKECLVLRARIDELQAEKLVNKLSATLNEETNDVSEKFSQFFVPQECRQRLEDLVPKSPNEIDIATQLQAYKNECIAWRTKSAQLEIAFKNHKHGWPFPTGMVNGDSNLKEELEESKRRIEELNEEVEELKEQAKIYEEAHLQLTGMADSGIEDTSGEKARSPEKRRESVATIAMSWRLAAVQKEISEKEEAFQENAEKSEELEQKLMAKTAEYEAANLNNMRLNSEIDTLRDEMSDLEDQIRSLENTLLQQGLSLGSQKGRNRRRLSVVGVEAQPLFRDTQSQSDVTSAAIERMQEHAKNLEEATRDLRDEFDVQRTEFEERIKELVENLNAKSSLANTLTHQIQTMNTDFELIRDNMEKDRKHFALRLDEVGAIAARVPILEMELAHTKQELEEVSGLQTAERENFEIAMESSLADAMESQQASIDQWKTRLYQTEAELARMKKRVELAEKNEADTKLRMSLEKVQLTQALEGSYNEMTTLTARVHASREDKQVTAFPDMKDKMITCYPKLHTQYSQAQPEISNRETQIFKGDLRDEAEEKLKFVGGELNTTRRQVSVLQQKLIEASELREQLEDVTNENKSLEEELTGLKKEHEALKTERVEIKARALEAMEAEEKSAKRARTEREHMQQVEREFEKVRQELDSVIKRYETEKKKMRAKVKHLESAAKERDALRAQLNRYRQLREIPEEIVDIQIIEEKVMEFIESEWEEEQQQRGYMSDPERLDDGDETKTLEPRVTFKGVDSMTLPSSTLMVAESHSTATPERALSVVMSPRKKQTAAAEFLLERIKLERDKFAVKLEEMEKTLGALAEENAVLKEHLTVQQTKPHRVAKPRACSMPHLLLNRHDEQKQELTHNSAAGELFATSDQIATLRVKNLCLLRENQRLLADMTSLRASVGFALEKHESCLSYVDSSAKFDTASTISAVSVNDLTTDLQAVRNDLEGILVHIDKATNIEESEGEEKKESRDGTLMLWLENEMKEEKDELNALTKWYELDKKRLEQELKSGKKDNATLQAHIDRMELEMHDVCRELELYKLEDALRAGTRVSNPSGGPISLHRAHSETELHCPKVGPVEDMSKWKWKAGSLFREVVKLRRDFNTAELELEKLREESVLQTGELEILRAQRSAEEDNEKFRSEMAKITAETEITRIRTEVAVLQAAQDVPYGMYENQYRWKAGEVRPPLDSEVDFKQREAPPLVVQKRQQALKAAETVRQTYEHQLRGMRTELEDLKLAAMASEITIRKLNEDRAAMSTSGITEEKGAEKQSQEVQTDILGTEIVESVSRTPSIGGRSLDALDLKVYTRRDTRMQTDILAREIVSETDVSSLTSDVETPPFVDASPPEKEYKEVQTDIRGEEIVEAESQTDLFVPQTADSNVQTDILAREIVESESQTDLLAGTADDFASQTEAQHNNNNSCQTETSTGDSSCQTDRERAPEIVRNNWESKDSSEVVMETQIRSRVASSVNSAGSSTAARLFNTESQTDPIEPVIRLETTDASTSCTDLVQDTSAKLPIAIPGGATRLFEKDTSSSISSRRSSQSSGEPFAEAMVEYTTNWQRSDPSIKSEMGIIHMEAPKSKSSSLEPFDPDTILSEAFAKHQKDSATIPSVHKPARTELTVLKQKLDEKTTETKYLRQEVGALRHQISSLQADLATLSVQASTALFEEEELNQEDDPTVLKEQLKLLKATMEIDKKLLLEEKERQGDEFGLKMTKMEEQMRTSQILSSSKVSVEAATGTDDSRSESNEQELDYDTAPDSDDADPAFPPSFKQLEERTIKAEKELDMVTKELEVCRDGYARDLWRLKAEKANLEKRLRDAAMSSDIDSDAIPGMETTKILKEKVGQLTSQMDEQERRHQEMYLIMFKKGQATARAEIFDRDTADREEVHSSAELSSKISTLGASKQSLSDEEVVLRFLRDAVYYYLMNRDAKDHLQAIMSLLKFSEKQRDEVRKIRH